MKIFKPFGNVALTGMMLAGLAACGSPADEPAEQIVVSEPGSSAAKPEDAQGNAPTASLAVAGKAAFAACVACHQVTAGAPSGIGPNLNGVVGRAAGSLAGYGYSSAMKASGITWTEAELDQYLTNPAKKVPGTSMAVAGISDAEKRAAITAYLASLPK